MILQYSTNFIIYAARSGQYRKAYILFLKSCLPWLFQRNSTSYHRSKRGINRIFIINPIMKRFSSTPDLFKYRNPKNGNLEENINLSLDLRFEKILCTSYVNDLKDSSTIVLIPYKIPQNISMYKQIYNDGNQPCHFKSCFLIVRKQILS